MGSTGAIDLWVVDLQIRSTEKSDLSFAPAENFSYPAKTQKINKNKGFMAFGAKYTFIIWLGARLRGHGLYGVPYDRGL